MSDMKIGDRIKFRAATRWSDRAVWRVIVGFDHARPLVRFGGWGNFIVRPSEIIDHESKS